MDPNETIGVYTAAAQATDPVATATVTDDASPLPSDAPRLLPPRRRTRLLLCVDGGGVRARATSRFLEHLETALGRRLHDVFDMFAGTSAGSFIAAGFACGRYNAREVRSLSGTANSRRVFSQTWCQWASSKLLYRPKYGGAGKADVLREMFTRTAADSTPMRMCDVPKPLVVAVTEVRDTTSVDWAFKSTGTDGRCEYSVGEVCDASSAAPTYFPGVVLGGGGGGGGTGPPASVYVDGGLSFNDPVMLAVLEAQELWPSDNIAVLSLGTGRAPVAYGGARVRRYGMLQWLPLLFEVLLDNSRSEVLVKEWCEVSSQRRYMRVNSTLPPSVSPALDDTSDENMAALKALGDAWWERFGDATLAFVRGDDENITQATAAPPAPASTATTGSLVVPVVSQ